MDSPDTIVMPIACYDDKKNIALRRAYDNLERAINDLERAILYNEAPHIIDQRRQDHANALHEFHLQRRLLLTPRTPPQPIPRSTVDIVDKRRRALRFAAIFDHPSPYSPNSSP